jgi:hypothetical protein
MIACRICRFETELDDVVLRHGTDECICLRCYDRETGGARLMPKALRREIDAVLATV